MYYHFHINKEKKHHPRFNAKRHFKRSGSFIHPSKYGKTWVKWQFSQWVKHLINELRNKPYQHTLSVDYKKASHRMYWSKLWNIMRDKEVPDCLLEVIQNWWKCTTVITDNKRGSSKNTEVINRVSNKDIPCLYHCLVPIQSNTQMPSSTVGQTEATGQNLTGA